MVSTQWKRVFSITHFLCQSLVKSGGFDKVVLWFNNCFQWDKEKVGFYMMFIVLRRVMVRILEPTEKTWSKSHSVEGHEESVRGRFQIKFLHQQIKTKCILRQQLTLKSKKNQISKLLIFGLKISFEHLRSHLRWKNIEKSVLVFLFSI
jgi:hypothetical protein